MGKLGFDETGFVGNSIGKTKDIRIEEQKDEKRSFLRNLSRKRTEKAADELGRHIGAKSGEVPPHQGQVSNGPTWEVGKVDKKRQSWPQENGK